MMSCGAKGEVAFMQKVGRGTEYADEVYIRDLSYKCVIIILYVHIYSLVDFLNNGCLPTKIIYSVSSNGTSIALT